ncbi:MAG: DNA-protecting protein DprA [Alphaproteobacteria bacterium]|nr:DNA-protecting protein DprA [Alphaproteobacteria bacterium]
MEYNDIEIYVVVGGPSEMLDDNTLDWIRLSNTNGIGSRKFWSLIKYYKTASEALKHVSQNKSKVFNKIFIEKFLHNNKTKVILATDNHFSDELKNNYYCPPVLYYRGDVSLLNKTKIAIIGARNSSISGKTIANAISKNLSCYFTIVSGMAHGIDTSALTSALDIGNQVVAVLPFGFDNVYPKDNIKLFERIAENGLVVTSVFPGKPPDPGMFHVRNRILVLLSKGIVVIEAAVKSGTMSTANLALDLGKEVMVVPGSPLDSRYYGSNLLIKNGAPLVQSAQDVLDIIGSNTVINHTLDVNSNNNFVENTKNNSRDICSVILSKLSTVPTTIDELVLETNLSVSQILSAVSELVLDGKVIKTPSNALVIS